MKILRSSNSKFYKLSIAAILAAIASQNVNAAESEQYNAEVQALLVKANEGDAEAQYELGSVHYTFFDEIDQCHWLLKASKKGHAKAQYSLFYQYCVDTKEGFEWIVKSAEGGYSKAQSKLAGIYDAFGDDPEYFNVDVDYTKALYWHTKAANNGDVTSQTRLGEIYSDDEEAKLYNVEKNIDNGIKWYKRASEKSRSAQSGLAYLYYHEKQDYKSAAKWFLSAAQQGHLYSQYSIGVQYSFGQGVLQNDKQAYMWYKKAIENDQSWYGYNRKWVAHSHHNIAVMYRKGEGVKKSAKEAAKHYLAAAKLGRAGSQFLMGHYYSVGEGVLQDYKKAYMWFNIARFNEHDADIALHIEEIERRMSGEDISEAQEMSKVCLESNYKDCD